MSKLVCNLQININFRLLEVFHRVMGANILPINPDLPHYKKLDNFMGLSVSWCSVPYSFIEYHS